MSKRVLVTGGAGFIGSHVVRRFVNNYPNYKIFNLDALTYAGNLENIADIEKAPNYTFVKGDIVDASFIDVAIDLIANCKSLAASSPLENIPVFSLRYWKTGVKAPIACPTF